MEANNTTSHTNPIGDFTTLGTAAMYITHDLARWQALRDGQVSRDEALCEFIDNAILQYRGCRCDAHALAILAGALALYSRQMRPRT